MDGVYYTLRARSKQIYVQISMSLFQRLVNSKHVFILRDRRQIEVNLSELINFCYPWNHQKTYCFLMISGEIEVN